MSVVDPENIKRRVRNNGADQNVLFEGADDDACAKEWWGMPSFEMNDSRPSYSITVHFHSFDDVKDFCRRLEVDEVTRKTKSLWFPPENLFTPSDFEYVDDSA